MLLNVDSLTVKFGGLTANSNVSFSLNSQELIGLIGPNGAGKTTCFNVLSGIYAPTSGKIFFEGAEISGWPANKIAEKGILRTFQNIRLFGSMSVLENLLVPQHPHREYGLLSALFRFPSFQTNEKKLREKSEELLNWFGLLDKKNIEAKNLPYGEQRKLEIARALAANPKLLLLDEPAAGMNPSETAELASLILRIRNEKKISILLIEHDMSLVMKICERIYVLDHGELIAQGKPQEIQKDPKVIEAYLGSGEPPQWD